MSVVYRDVLERFVKYREQRNISQNELAQMLCISQSYVSKMEVGKARISFDILTALYQQGWDIDYIITGQENRRTVLNDLYESCKEDCRADFLQYMIWTVMQGIKSYEKQVKQVMRYIEKCIHRESQPKIMHFTASERSINYRRCRWQKCCT